MVIYKINNLNKKSFISAALLLFTSLILNAQTSRPIVSNINAIPSSTTTILISWTLPEKTEGYEITSLTLYRDTRPITGNDFKGDSLKIATLSYDAVSYTDTLNDYREYYYAVISCTKQGDYKRNSDKYYDEQFDKNENTSGGEPYLILLPGVNSTVNGVRVKSPVKKSNLQKKTTESAKEKIYGEGDMREEPLPFLDILGTDDKHEPTISMNTEKKALDLAGGKQTKSTPIPLAPYFFEQDMMSPEGGDEYLLYDILKSTFVVKNYPAATAALKRFLAQNRTVEVTNRAVFYLGESYYFCSKYKDALNRFLAVEEQFPSLSKKWIESTLELYEIPETNY